MSIPIRIIETLVDMADRAPKGSRGPWQYAEGTEMQDDADAALAELCRLAAVEQELEALKASMGEPVAQIVALGQYEFHGLEWISADHSFRATIGSQLYALSNKG